MNTKTHTQAATERFQQELDTAYHNGYNEGQKHPLGACDHAAAVRAYNDGFFKGKADGLRLGRTQCGYVYPPALKERDDKIAQLEKEISGWRRTSDHQLELIGVAFKNGEKKALDDLAGRYPWREIDEKSKEITELKNLADTRATRIDALIKQRDEARVERDEEKGLAILRLDRIRVLEMEISKLNKAICDRIELNCLGQPSEFSKTKSSRDWASFVEDVNRIDRSINSGAISLRYDSKLPEPGPGVPEFQFFGWKVFRR